MWYNTGMSTSDVISLVAAILIGGGTLALAIMTWKSIRQTRSIQKVETRERRLKEICDWLESVIRCGGEVNLKFMKTPKITPIAEKEIAEEAIAQYFLVSSKINFISKISFVAGIPLSSFKNIEDGIIDVMKAIDRQLSNKKFDIASLYTNHVMPLNNKCSDLMGEIALLLGEEVKLEQGKK